MCNTNQSLSSQLLLRACFGVEKYVIKKATKQAKKMRKRINKLPYILKGNGVDE